MTWRRKRGWIRNWRPGTRGARWIAKCLFFYFLNTCKVSVGEDSLEHGRTKKLLQNKGAGEQSTSFQIV